MAKGKVDNVGSEAEDTKYVTGWWMPNEMMDSQYGRLTFAEWCEKEVRRITAKTPNCKLQILTEGKHIAIVRV